MGGRERGWWGKGCGGRIGQDNRWNENNSGLFKYQDHCFNQGHSASLTWCIPSCSLTSLSFNILFETYQRIPSYKCDPSALLLNHQKMYGGGFGGGFGGQRGFGYSSPADTNPFIPGTQRSPYDADPTRPGIQAPGSFNGVPHYSSARDTDPYRAGTQLNRFDADPTRPGIQLPGSVNGVPHYSSPYDQNPYIAGTQNYGGQGFGGGFNQGGYGRGW